MTFYDYRKAQKYRVLGPVRVRSTWFGLAIVEEYVMYDGGDRVWRRAKPGATKIISDQVSESDQRALAFYRDIGP